MENVVVDTLIVGASAAGLSAALILGRSLRNVLIVDAGKPCNRSVKESHSMPGFDGKSPAQILQSFRKDANSYPSLRFLSDTVTYLRNIGSDGFEFRTEGGISGVTRTVLLATGIKDILPEVEGLGQFWGTLVAHCPFCHAHEFKGKPFAFIHTGSELSLGKAKLLGSWTDTIHFITQGYNISPEATADLQSFGLTVVEDKAVRVDSHPEHGLRISLSSSPPLYVAVINLLPSTTQSDHRLADQLGCQINADDLIVTKPDHSTTVEGVWAAGDNSTALRQISVAVANGAVAGIQIHLYLTLKKRRLFINKY